MSLFFATAAILAAGILIFKIKSKSRSAQELCFICEKPLVNPLYHDQHAFCPDHLDVYREGEWKTLFQGSASAASSEAGVKIYHAKMALVNAQCPSFIQISYEDENGEIVTKMKLMVLKADLEKAWALSKSILF